MEENVALDSKKQKKFDKSIKGIKKLLKKNEEKPHKPAVLAPKDEESKGGKKKWKRPERGLVYLSHIPHGFYEHEMTQYFKQFGMVTNARVIRSARTGGSKGYAFVEFREPAVAEIVAETMNNYLMGKRLIKAAIIPPEKQRRRVFRKHWNSQNNPTALRRVKERKVYNAIKTDEKYLKTARKMLSHLNKTKKKLNDLGINYDFFKPVDVPEALLENANVKTESEKSINVKKEAEEKKNKKKKVKVEENKEKVTKDKSEPKRTKSADIKSKKEVKKIKESDKVKQHEKQKKMQDAGMKIPENFIKIAPGSGEDSESSLEFDSDEYEKMLEKDSDASSGDESEDGDENEDNGSDDDESEEDIPPLVSIKQKKAKKPIVAQPPPSKKEAKPATIPKVQKPQTPQPKPPKKGPIPANVQGQRPPRQQQGVKRKGFQIEGSPKKHKFEKKDKPRNKQFKKKNKA